MCLVILISLSSVKEKCIVLISGKSGAPGNQGRAIEDVVRKSGTDSGKCR